MKVIVELDQNNESYSGTLQMLRWLIDWLKTKI